MESAKAWATNPKTHPFKVEWLKYEPDSLTPKEVMEKPCIAFKVKSIEEESKGLRVLIEQF